MKETFPTLTDIAEQFLGNNERKLTHNRSKYLSLHPENVVFFDAHIYINKQWAWSGDIDYTYEKEFLIDLAYEVEGELYLFESADDGDYKKQMPCPKIISFYCDGSAELDDDTMVLAEKEDELCV